MNVAEAFGPGILDDAFIAQKRKEHDESGPYLHAVVQGLVNEDLLRRARNEIVEELHFTEKETDIYKVNQTGDLANLDGLPPTEAERLKALLELRNALYSDTFRSWVQRVTGCGPLSATKKDMSINDYRHGCHLLNHDDVISTRRVSYILYLPDPEQPWQPEWGGALELYPVKDERSPDNVPTKIIPPQWNQFAFFRVQPGHSFHSVEEVVSPTQSRLSISGWFHRLQPEEPGFDAEHEAAEVRADKEFSSLESLSSKMSTSPFEEFPGEPPLPGSAISDEDKAFLANFINTPYLTEKVQATLYDKFGDESHLLLADFLRKDLADALESALRAKDIEDGLVWFDKGTHVAWESVRIAPHAVGTVSAEGASEEDKRWELVGPAHRQRFASLSDPVTPASAKITNFPASLPTSASDLLHILTHQLFPSTAFRHLVANITQLIPLAGRPIRVRRFRPGLDYTLARSDEEAVLDLTLTLTPDVLKSSKAAERKTSKPKGLAGKRAKTVPAPPSTKGVLGRDDMKKLESMWDTGDIGGWECYMAPHEGEEDPAVYQSSHKGKHAEEPEKGANTNDDEPNEDDDGEEANNDDEDENDDDDDFEDEDMDDDFDGVLLNVTPSFNTLNVVLRDEGVMRFVKYLAACAGGSRWDVAAEFTVGAAEVEEMDEN
ncbi:putative component of NuA3 histone acetyltransferase complex [Malassezia cuniculi]|uniref:uS12 prolyl 3,4-dihydroxylase n=1 Tax=Malassezia cuniculi TaxID=948313 RepID=A0AAF0EWE4_9BASI|nr:putative component of NuA3 histone acetyltransferase complex [Malassezia cuniculi]